MSNFMTKKMKENPKIEKISEMKKEDRVDKVESLL